MAKQWFAHARKGFDLCSSGVGRQERVIRRIPFEEGEEMVREFRARRIIVDGELKGFQLCSHPGPAAHLRRALFANRLPEAARATSSAAFSKAEVDAIAGLRGESKTEGLTDEQRAERILRGWRGEDVVEASRKKLNVYRKVH
jgi:hypothetical protein